MTNAEKMRMLLAEAGFVEGHQYESIRPFDSGGYCILFGHRYDNDAPGRERLEAAIDKAWNLIGGPVIEYPWTIPDYLPAAHFGGPDT